MTEPGPSVRLDKWLWAARFYKTRTAATAAVEGGKIEVDGGSAKPARQVSPGDRIRIRITPFTWDVVVIALASRRGTGAQAAALYEEDPASRSERELHAKQLREAPQLKFAGGKPGKRDRRRLDKLRGRE